MAESQGGEWLKCFTMGFPEVFFTQWKRTWMSQEVGKCLVNGLFHLLINEVYWGYNLLEVLPFLP